MIINENKSKINEDANHQLIYDPETYGQLSLEDMRLILSDQIGANDQGEVDAIRGYYRLITMLNSLLNTDASLESDVKSAIDSIKEIISDEKNHQLKLVAIRNWMDGNIPTNED